MDLGKHRETAKMSAAGVIAVIIAGVTASLLAPETELGQIIKFFTPLVIGILFGAKIYFNELGKVKEKIEK